MATNTIHPPAGKAPDQPPPDIETMRETADRLLDPDAASDILPPTVAEVDTLTRTMRGQLELLIPDIKRLVGGRPKNIAQYCALACVGEARRKLSIEPGPGLDAGTAFARRLARVLNALCDHYERLSEAAS
ncbi:DUF6415 family natural product biosynthesis protein [Streptomyces sp. NPDC058469]|uniref:DUF6415 family natural product biosynthesis protein n=1 Tax=Streptomyces sp. NPDC058469 TaxID=3346514 RepID=UPI00364D9D48